MTLSPSMATSSHNFNLFLEYNELFWICVIVFGVAIVICCTILIARVYCNISAENNNQDVEMSAELEPNIGDDAAIASTILQSHKGININEQLKTDFNVASA